MVWMLLSLSLSPIASLSLSVTHRLSSQRLREIDETYDNGVAWIFAGSNYLALPWPIKSADKARVRFRKAQGISAESPRNLYFSALAAMEAGSTKQAAKLFQRSLDAPAVSTSDRDLEGFLREQAKAGLAKCP